MKYFLIASAFFFFTSVVQAQKRTHTTGAHRKMATKSMTPEQKATVVDSIKNNQKKQPAGTAVHGGKLVPLHHGKHDYTPGSPIGTGGAGGSSMSGSPQSSASENALGKKPGNELIKTKKSQKPNKVVPNK